MSGSWLSSSSKRRILWWMGETIRDLDWLCYIIILGLDMGFTASTIGSFDFLTIDYAVSEMVCFIFFAKFCSDFRALTWWSPFKILSWRFCIGLIMPRPSLFLLLIESSSLPSSMKIETEGSTWVFNVASLYELKPFEKTEGSCCVPAGILIEIDYYPPSEPLSKVPNEP